MHSTGIYRTISGDMGSIAGTALRNSINRLLEDVVLTGDTLGGYEFSALKSDGTMKTFAETINELWAELR